MLLPASQRRPLVLKHFAPTRVLSRVWPKGALSALGSPRFTVFCMSLAWAFTTIVLITFAAAAGSEGHRVAVTVNEYSEMFVEAVLFGIAWLLISANAVMLWRNLGRKR